MKNLEFLNFGEATSKQMFLQHITELVQVKINNQGTYNDMFAKLQEKFSDSPERLKAVNSYIEMNKDHQEDARVFDTIINDTNNSNLFALFNMHNH